MKDRQKIFLRWLYARRALFLYVAVLYGCFFIVYGLYGYGWGVAGYAALLGLVAGFGFSLWDFTRFTAKYLQLERIVGRFPTASLPEADTLLEQEYTAVVQALEEERAKKEAENEQVRRDAQEYYTLWTHQIKTPLAAMNLLLQSEGETLPAQIKKDLEQELLRVGQYVEMALEYQRLSSMQNDLVLRRHSLESLVKKAAKKCAPLFIYKKLALEIEPLSAEIITDEKWFCLVLEQLFTNAVKYTSRGKVRVYEKEPGCLVVEDTGTGIPQEDLPRVFERGFTGKAGRDERSSTGIGLYLCRQVLENLGFGISLSSRQGEGTQVFLSLSQQELEIE
ncbi:HAMP domain-containing histidine kinase [Ruminococcaceae bacterium OttesenSCG-928-I18]|nr:HAMP domain-containing histidine kinase [Ruminococcaceae bacterium OttesenSCG-928-I18]